LNNRDNILLSKELVTIDKNVPVELDVAAMKAGEPDVESLRSLFTELEFTSLLKELLPVVQVTEAHYSEAKSAAEVEAILAAVDKTLGMAIAVECDAPSSRVEAEDEEDFEEGMLPLSAAPQPRVQAGGEIAISAAPGTATSIALAGDGARQRLVGALIDEAFPKAIHDYKSAVHLFAEHGITLRGVRHDSRLYSYLLDPTYSAHGLAEVALRRFNLKLSGTLPEAADIAGRLASALRGEVEQSGLLKVYDEIDLPLVEVLARMEEAGVAIDRNALSEMSARLEREIDAKAREIYECAG